jgi:hypothetical protein
MCATVGKDGRAAAVELRSVKKKGAGVGAPGRDLEEEGPSCGSDDDYD